MWYTHTMWLFLGTDHNGAKLARFILRNVRGVRCELVNRESRSEDDYPVLASKVVRRVLATSGAHGVLLCGSGNGMAMAANRFPGIRAAVALNVTMARKARQDENANVLVIPAWWVTMSAALRTVRAFLSTPASSAVRHRRRIRQLSRLPRG